MGRRSPKIVWPHTDGDVAGVPTLYTAESHEEHAKHSSSVEEEVCLDEAKYNDKLKFII